jgi:hypothetical protein
VSSAGGVGAPAMRQWTAFHMSTGIRNDHAAICSQCCLATQFGVGCIAEARYCEHPAESIFLSPAGIQTAPAYQPLLSLIIVSVARQDPAGIMQRVHVATRAR